MERLSEATPASGDVRAFVQALREEARNHRALRHPYLSELVAGTYPDPIAAIADLGSQELSYQRRFGRCVTAAIGQVETPGHRALLLDVLCRDQGQLSATDALWAQAQGIDLHWIVGVSRARLLRRFLDALGHDVPEAHPATHLWSREMMRLCEGGRGGAAQVIGGLGLGEIAVSAALYRPILAAAAAHTPTTVRDRAFFVLRAAADASLADAFTEAAGDLAAWSRGQAALRFGMLRSLALRASFFDTMRHRALSMSPVQ